MTHVEVDAVMKKTLGINENPIRLSVGIENVYDLIADIDSDLLSV